MKEKRKETTQTKYIQENYKKDGKNSFIFSFDPTSKVLHS